MFAADAKLQVRPCSPSFFCRHLHQLPYAVLVQFCKRIGLINLALIVRCQEFARIVTGEAEGHLCQIVGSKGEEFCLLRYLICQKRRPRNLDHRSNMILNIRIFLFLYRFRNFYNHFFYIFQFFLIAYQRNHNFRHDIIAFLFLYLDSCFHHCPRLHSRNFRISNRQTASPVAHHRIELMQRVAGSLYFLYGQVHVLRQVFDILFFRRNKFMKRRIEETDRHWPSFHHFV